MPNTKQNVLKKKTMSTLQPPSCRKDAIKNKITPTLLFQVFFVRQVLRNKKKNHAEHENNRGDREQYAHSILLIT